MKIFLLLTVPTLFLPAHTLTHYTAHPPRCYGDKAILRTFDLDGQLMQLVVDTHTLHTAIEPRGKTLGQPCGNSRYLQNLNRSASVPWPLTNDGITHQKGHGTALSTDLCPSSKKGFEKQLYETIITRFKTPVPVTLFLSGRWIRRHPEAFRQFQQWEQEGKLAITWGNHTYTHPYRPGKPLKSNFALTPGYDLRADTLRLEKMLIRQGITPSVFFRFPGLVSDKKTIRTIHDLGLITIGTDAWIAKGQHPKEGSIILLHGNKNEPKGVKMFLEMLTKGQIKHIAPLHP